MHKEPLGTSLPASYLQETRLGLLGILAVLKTMSNHGWITTGSVQMGGQANHDLDLLKTIAGKDLIVTTIETEIGIARETETAILSAREIATGGAPMWAIVSIGMTAAATTDSDSQTTDVHHLNNDTTSLVTMHATENHLVDGILRPRTTLMHRRHLVQMTALLIRVSLDHLVKSAHSNLVLLVR